MSILERYAPSRWLEFLNIPDETFKTTPGEDLDLVIGGRQVSTVTIRNGVAKYRDIIALGHLTLKTSPGASIIARNLITVGKVTLDGAKVEVRNSLQISGKEFRTELRELLSDWLQMQRESVNQIGLKSIW